MFFKLIKVHLLVSELYAYQNSQCNDKKILLLFTFRCYLSISLECQVKSQYLDLVYLISVRFDREIFYGGRSPADNSTTTFGVPYTWKLIFRRKVPYKLPTVLVCVLHWSLITGRATEDEKRDRQSTKNVTLKRFPAAIVAVQKQ